MRIFSFFFEDVWLTMAIVNPTIVELCEKVDCRYTLVVEASKRARQLLAGAQPLIDAKDMTGAVVERTFNPTDKMPRAVVDTREMQYVYSDGGLYYFMDLESYEQIPVNKDQVEDAIPYVKEGTNVTVRFFKGAAFNVTAPNFVELEVTDTEPGFKGDTASNTYKPATVETGYTLQVPLFINIGDRIRIDTRVGEYMERC